MAKKVVKEIVCQLCKDGDHVNCAAYKQKKPCDCIKLLLKSFEF